MQVLKHHSALNPIRVSACIRFTAAVISFPLQILVVLNPLWYIGNTRGFGFDPCSVVTYTRTRYFTCLFRPSCTWKWCGNDNYKACSMDSVNRDMTCWIILKYPKTISCASRRRRTARYPVQLITDKHY